MMVIGYRPNANFVEAQRVIKKHTAFNTSDVKNIVEHIREGKGVKLPDDFVLREDLEDLNFLVD
jgi:transcription elongation factor GreA-like protein